MAVSLYYLPKEIAVKWKGVSMENFSMLDFFCDLESNRVITDADFDIHTTIDFFTDKQLKNYYIAFRLVTKELFLSNILRIGYCSKDKENLLHNNSNLTKQNETLSNEKIEQLLRIQGDLSFIATLWNEGNFLITNKYKNISLSDNKQTVSDSVVQREKDIFDYIHIYKIFDWENDSMLAVGS